MQVRLRIDPSAVPQELCTAGFLKEKSVLLISSTSPSLPKVKNTVTKKRSIYGVIMQLREIAAKIKAEVYVPFNVPMDINIEGLFPLDTAQKKHISFFYNPKYENQLSNTQAGAVVLKERRNDSSFVQLIHPNPYLASAEISLLFYNPKHSFCGRSEQAFIHPEAFVHPEATIYPFCFIDRNARIEKNVTIYPHCFVGEECTIGENSVLYPGVVLMKETLIGKNVILHAGTVLGADGFGFVPSKEGIKKIPQVGRVVIKDNVEMGALCTVDRATFGETVVGKNSKLDDHVHLAHNVRTGENCLFCGQAAVGGSTVIGNNFISAGKTGVVDNLRIPDNVVLGAHSVFTQDPPGAGKYLGIPAVNDKEWHKQVVALRKLPDLLKRVRQLEEALEKINEREK